MEQFNPLFIRQHGGTLCSLGRFHGVIWQGSIPAEDGPRSELEDQLHMNNVAVLMETDQQERGETSPNGKIGMDCATQAIPLRRCSWADHGPFAPQ